ncbi:MAG: glycoside hydrolase family 32 protein [Cytophagales bacterium]|nr:glycoside hydrolase family 32 protein [Cytophagales bacterium]
MNNLKSERVLFLVVLFLTLTVGCNLKEPPESKSAKVEIDREKHRPLFHFSPDSMWMNDPNGMVFYRDTYHLFYQYHPESTVWGPMHWGHAVSKDMINWEHKPVALYPDEHGYIFSGSAVLDVNNTSGLGSAGNPPLVAIYTYHNPVKAEARRADAQTQGIAYSRDGGESWIKYEKNPVLSNPGIRDFRDPKVRWHEATQCWIMTLAVQDHIRFYSSPNLKKWSYESEFGKEQGAHGGVWECPDLFPLKVEDSDEEYWILIVNLNPGGPNGGSGVQYFIGSFDDHRFTSIDKDTRWLDYGPDNYAGVTWSNTGDRTLFLGWMSNWKYANVVPTQRWRSAMTIARELKLHKHGNKLAVYSLPVNELGNITSTVFEKKDFDIHKSFSISDAAKLKLSTFEMDLGIRSVDGFKVVLSNANGNQTEIVFDHRSNRFFIDRSKSGDTSFHKEFGDLAWAPRFSHEKQMDLKLVADVASVELFADEGSTVMTAIYFPDAVFDQVEIVPDSKLSISKLVLNEVR